MKRRMLLIGAAGLAIAVWMIAQNASQPASPLVWYPRGAMLAIEVRNFGALLREWNASEAKKEWLAGASYKQFAVSRLAQRLAEVQEQLADAAKVPVDLNSLQQIAGDYTTIALYNPADMEVLFVTRTPEARFASSLLGQQRGRLSPRNAAGTPYFVAFNPATRRTVAFATRGEWLLVATTEALLAEALQRMVAAQAAGGLASEDWLTRGSQLAGAQGEIRMWSDVDSLYRSPYFRSYWIHRNRAELAPFASIVNDFERQNGVWTDRRVLVRKQPTAASPASPALATLLRSVPRGAGLYRAWLSPDADEVSGMLVRKLVEPARDGMQGPSIAPHLEEIAAAGEEQDWENRIDEAPFVPEASGMDRERFRRWIRASAVTAMLHVQSTSDSPDTVWIQMDSGFVLLREGNWQDAAVRAELDALPIRIQYAIAGNALYLAQRAPMLSAMRTAASPVPSLPNGTRFAGGFRHGSERARFARWMQRIDQPNASEPQPGQEREPIFLNDTVGGLSNILRGFDEQTVVIADLGDRVQQTVAYRTQP